MARTWISTTVDAHRLSRLRRELGVTDSELVHRAPAALLENLEVDRERRVLVELPYEDDPDLAWQAPAGSDLPYDGEIPADVLALARERRRSSQS